MSTGDAQHEALTRRAEKHLKALAGEGAVLRDEQQAAIQAVVGERRRALVVQRTGFGKSAIYFIATKLLREGGAGPTLLVSPLLALMRDQVAAAERMGVRSVTINSTNLDEWDTIEEHILAGSVDLVCISPERLNNPGFAERILPRLASGLGLLVVDEAHCISDWGHDFRPDYRRIRDAIRNLQPGTPVIATTATANERVTADVVEQLGTDVLVLRGTLERESLHLGVKRLDTLAERLAWTAAKIPQLTGTGIVYCLTVAQTTQVAEYLQSRGVDAAAYSSETTPEERSRLETAFKRNEVKALVATSALGMGVDKPDVSYVIHLGAPSSPIAYYQQVGRAGRSVPRAEAWLLPGKEDQAIWEWFMAAAMPPEHLVRRVLEALRGDGLTLNELERVVDLKRTRLETLLKILDVDGAVTRDRARWHATGAEWVYDKERVERISAERRDEAAEMLSYAEVKECLMLQLRRSLDDPGATACGRCQVCTGADDGVTLTDEDVQSAVAYLRTIQVHLPSRKQWPRGLAAPKGNLKAAERAADGIALSRVQDAGWWPLVEEALKTGDVPDELVHGLAAALKRWEWEARPGTITWMPGANEAALQTIAERLGRLGRIPVTPLVKRARAGAAQTSTGNSAHRLRNVWEAFEASPCSGVVLLLDDYYDSGWTMTVAAKALREAGAGVVLPLALARR